MNKSFFLILPLISQLVFAHEHKKCSGFVPQNSLNFSYDNKSNNEGLNKDQFDKAIDKVESVYQPIFKALGKNLKINRHWDDSTVNAYASNSENGDSVVSMFGGLARYPGITEDAFQLVVCHEIGHHIGGLPFYPNFQMSTEGQADYFATLKCSRQLWLNDNNFKFLKDPRIPLGIRIPCQLTYSTEVDRALCVRAGIAGSNLHPIISGASLNILNTEIMINKMYWHPEAQCRLDTYRAGALCTISKDELNSSTDFSQGNCTEQRGSAVGMRPACWYSIQDRAEYWNQEIKNELMKKIKSTIDQFGTFRAY